MRCVTVIFNFELTIVRVIRRKESRFMITIEIKFHPGEIMICFLCITLSICLKNHYESLFGPVKNLNIFCITITFFKSKCIVELRKSVYIFMINPHLFLFRLIWEIIIPFGYAKMLFTSLTWIDCCIEPNAPGTWHRGFWYSFFHI